MPRDYTSFVFKAAAIAFNRCGKVDVGILCGAAIRGDGDDFAKWGAEEAAWLRGEGKNRTNRTNREERTFHSP